MIYTIIGNIYNNNNCRMTKIMVINVYTISLVSLSLDIGSMTINLKNPVFNCLQYIMNRPFSL